MSAPHAVIDFSASAEGLRPLRLAFGTPTRELFAWSFDEVRAVLGEVHRLAMRGNWSVGYLRYEANGAFEPTASLHPPDGPLAYFSVHEQAMELPELSGDPSTSIDWKPQNV